MHGRIQPTPHESVKEYTTRVCVAGSRGFNDYALFSEIMSEYITTLGDERFIFISGKAKTGADDLIIRWCFDNNYPWAEYPADWDNLEAPGAVVRYTRDSKPYNVRAGFERNAKMGLVLTHLVTFYDGVSSGTADMIKEALRKKAKVSNFLIDIDKKR